MYQTELIYFMVLTVTILLSEFMPTGLLLLLDNFLSRILIVLLLLYLISLGPTAGILGFMAISSLYLERNRRKVKVAAEKIDLMDNSRSNFATVEEAAKPQTTVPVNDFDVPQNEESDFFPVETCESDNFQPVAPTINEKVVLSTIYPLNKTGPEAGDASDVLYEEMGFGHIPGVETVGQN